MSHPTLRCRIVAGLALAGILGPFAGGAGAYTAPAAADKYLDRFRSYSTLTSKAGSTPDVYGVNITTWQMSHGGFSKAMESSYLEPWDGSTALSAWSANGIPLGMFDNNATVMEMQFLANLYKTTKDATVKAKVKTAVNKAVGFVLTSQYASGGWPQVYPKRGNYSDHATYNDNAMLRVMVLVKDILAKRAPFDSDIIDAASQPKLQTALDKAVDFTIRAQIVNGANPTVWCAQHDPVSFKPMGARAYELPSKSGSESAGLVAFLIAWPNQTTEVQKAVKGALAWYKATRVKDLKFSNGLFVAASGASMWYRFYNVDDDRQFFCDRDGIKTYDFMSVSEERRTGYQWGGDYGSGILALESAYLTALTGSVGTRARSAQEPAARVRLAEGKAIAAVQADGMYTVRWSTLTGRVVAEHKVVAQDRELTIPVPAGFAASVAILAVARSGQPAESVHAIPVR